MTGQTGTNGTELKESAAARLAAARDEYVAAAQRGRAGRDVARRYADQMDAVVQAIVGAAGDQRIKPFAVCAVGGYGRRVQCLHSDVDLLLVFDGAIGPAEEAWIKSVLQPLWDLGLELGQHVRELADFIEPDLSNPEFLLSLLDHRYLVGERTVYQRVAESASPLARAALDPLLGLVEERHKQFNDTIYQLEPDIKQAPGGLRDIAVVRHLRALAPEAFEHGRQSDSVRVAEAEDFLL